MEAPGVDGWAAFEVDNSAISFKFKGYGMGSYSFFHQGVNIWLPTRLRSPAP